MTTTLLESSAHKHLPGGALSPVATFHTSSNASITKMPGEGLTARLLYRGSLSLPDTHMLLDGLTFTINLPIDSNASVKLLESPLPLALESLRGRPSLGLVDVVKMEGIYCEDDSEVYLHVHPRSVLTYQLFTNTLCSKPVLTNGRTELGIRICLGESGDLSASSSATLIPSNDVVVFGQPHPSSSNIMQLRVARILPPPAQIKASVKNANRPPRPDDPTPRKPPATFGLARITVGMKRNKDKGKGKEPVVEDPGPAKKRAKKGMNGTKSSPQFKLPPLPAHKVTTKGTVTLIGPNDEDMKDPILLEEHKMAVKLSTKRQLVSAGVPKDHTDFQELYSNVYRGSVFSLRFKLGTTAFDAELKSAARSDGGYESLLDSVVEWHIKMYLTECPGIMHALRNAVK